MTWRPLPCGPGEAPGWCRASDSTLRRALITDNRALLGRWGEEQAAGLVELCGGTVLERNLRFGSLELDLVCRWGGELALTEVRSRRMNNLQDAAATLGPSKWSRLVRGAALYVESRAWTGPWRIDLITCDCTLREAFFRLYRGIEGEVGL